MQESSLQKVLVVLKEAWPEHDKFLGSRFDTQEEGLANISEYVAALILKLTGDNLLQFCNDYRWMCGKMLQEEVYFRRYGRYRMTSQHQAYNEIYSQSDYMSRYINGLLLSQLLWSNQTSVFDVFCNRFLPLAESNSNYLEIGPGHGLFLYYADKMAKFSSLSAWDISESSLKATRHALDILGASRNIELEISNITTPVVSKIRYSAVVISEVLEHLDDPESVLKNLYDLIPAGGLLFVNIPVNSPAPDHIFLWNTPELFIDLVTSCGFEIVETHLFPMTGHSLEKARSRKLTINTCLIARKPNS